jgi:hypothetical protein
VIHFTCDRCKRILDPHDEIRYIVNMECRAAMDVFASDEEPRDHLLEVHEILESADLMDEEVGTDVYQQLRFDLCPTCYRHFIKAPVGREPMVEFDFSEN